MTFFTTREALCPYQVDQRDRHTDLIKTITGASQVKAKTLAEYLQLREIQNIPNSAMVKAGFSDAQIKRLRAAYDFGKSQFLGIQRIDLGGVIDDPAIAAKLAQELIGDSRLEKGCLLILDTKHQLIHREVFTVGSDTECIINPKVIFEVVLRHGGTRFIFSHNHPSGSLDPSPEDLRTTEALIKLSDLMELPILDHLIVSRDQYISLRQYTCLWS